MEAHAREVVSEQAKQAVPLEDQTRLEREAGQQWDRFYSQHQNKFFKDRHWLFTEFPELLECDTKADHELSDISREGCEWVVAANHKKVILEVSLENTGGQFGHTRTLTRCDGQSVLLDRLVTWW